MLKKKEATFNGNDLSKARINNGLTQMELAYKVGVSQSFVSHWEKGRAQPKQEELQKLEKILGINFGAKKKEGRRLEKADSESSPIGAWLTKSRIKKGITVAELAEVSGVAIPTIYAIESGRIKNPRDLTMKQLETALEETIPQETKNEVKDEATVEGVGEIGDFNPHDPENYPSVGGVYVFYDISSRPIYVGKAKKIDSRVKQYKDKFWFKEPIVDHAMFINIENDTLRSQIEKILIKFMKKNAVLNVQNVDRDESD